MDMEVKEGELREDHGVLFKKVGAELCVLDAEAEGGCRHAFSTIPLQALAVSNKFGLTFFIDSDGLCVALTADLVQASQELVDTPKAKRRAKEICITSVTIPKIQMLALSSNELTIAACLETTIHFYNVPMLLQKNKAGNPDKASLEPVLVLDNQHAIKEFAWSPTRKDTYFCLSRGGTLKTGAFVHESKVIAEGVEAADWSPDGEYLSYITQDRSLHAFKVASSAISTFVLPMQMFGDTSPDEVQVDTIKWVRFDSMLVTFVHIDVNGQEDDCLVFLLHTRGGHFAKDAKSAELLSYDQFFTSIGTSIIPTKTGPYVVANYVQPWEMVIATSRRSIDDHIALLGWLQGENELEPYKFELVNDNYMPRIELQDCGDDNGVVGLAVDLTTSCIQLPAPSGEGGEKLPPGPLLLCMTLEGYLTLFSMARTDPKWMGIEVITPPAPVPNANDVAIFQKVPEKRPQGEPIKDLSTNDGVSSFNDKREQSDRPSLADGIEEERNPKLGLVNCPKEATISTQSSTIWMKQAPYPPASATLPSEPVQESQGPSVIQEIKRVQQVEESVLLASTLVQQAELPAVKPSKSGKHAQDSPVSAVQASRPMRQVQGPSASVLQVSKPMQQAQGPPTSSIQASKPIQQAQGPPTSSIQGPSASVLQVSKPMQQAQGPPTSSIQASKPIQQAQGPPASAIQSRAPAILDPKQVPDFGALPMQPKIAGLSKLEPTRGPFLSDMEADFVNELDKVKAMAKELDELLLLIEGRGSVRKGDQRRIFMKSSLVDVESGIQTLSGKCHHFQTELKDQRQYISDLWDETMQVDAWRIYVQSLLEQSSDNHYQDLWNKQKLHPEMDTMRKRILKVDQLLKHQIAVLEEHIHNLELSQWWKKRSQSASQTRSLQSSENFHRMQALYGTVNTQMVVAEKLAERLAAQIEAFKLYSITKEGVNGLIDMSTSKLQSMGLNEVSAKKRSEHSSRSWPVPFQRDSADGSPLRTGLNYTLSTPQKPDNTHGTNASLLDSTRRRRDSLDKLWSDVGTAKTTVKRATPERVSPSAVRGVFQNENSQVKPLSLSCTTQQTTRPTEVAEAGAMLSRPQVSTLKLNERSTQTGKVFSFDMPERKYSFEVDNANATSSAKLPSLSNSLSDSVALVSTEDVLRFGTTDVKSLSNNTVTSNSRETSGSFSLKSSGLLPPASQLGLSKLGGTAEPSVPLSSSQQANFFKFNFQNTTRIDGVHQKVEAGNDVEKPKVQQYIGQGNNSRALPLSKAPQQSMASATMASGDVQQNDLLMKMVKGAKVDEPNMLHMQKSASSTESVDKLNLGVVLSTVSGTSLPSTAPAEANQATTFFSRSTTFSSPSTCLSSTPLISAGASSFPFGSSSQPATSVREISSPAAALPITSPVSISPTTSDPATSRQLAMAPTTAPAIASQLNVLPAATLSSPPTFSCLIPPTSTSTSPVFSFGPSFGASGLSSANLFGGEAKALGPPQTLAPAASPVTPFTAPAPPTISDEEEMEEEASSSMLDLGSGSFLGFGIGSSTPSAGLQNANNPFGGSLVGSQPSSGTPMSAPSGQLFKPAAFSLPTSQSSSQHGTCSSFGSSFGSSVGGDFGAGSSSFGISTRPAMPAFGQLAQPGLSQQVLGSSLGTFGQTRQIGSPFGAPSFPSTGSSFATGGGFAGAATGGGFASTATGAGFANAATGGGFAGFSSAAGGGGFESFAGSPVRPTFGGNFSTFGSSTNSSIFTQMRK